MKVLFDISVLGLGELEAKARTGVFRVVENLAFGLGTSPECEVEFRAGGEGFHAIYGAHRYLRRERRLAGVSFRSAAGPSRLRRRALAACVRGMESSATRRLAGVGRAALARGSYPLLWDDARGFDIFHSPHAPLPPRSGRSRVKRVLTVYDLIAVQRPDLFEPHVEPYVRQILASIEEDDRVICISESTRRDLCEYTGIDPARVSVAPLAASRTLFQPIEDRKRIEVVRARYGIPEGRYLLSLNTLEPRKNLVTAIRAFANVVEAGERDLSLVLVGGRGWHFESVLEAAARVPGVRERIIFAGFVDDEDLAPLYSGAHAFMYPSLYEGFGLPALEAMQCGVPVVTSNSSSLPEVVGDAGIQIPPEEVDGFTDALSRLLKSEELRAELSRRSIERAANFSWARCVRETIGAYRAALDG